MVPLLRALCWGPWALLIFLQRATGEAHVHLVQVAASRSPRNQGIPQDQCLRFMHIPKTGGTSIDLANMDSTPPAFDSLMLRTFDRLALKHNWSSTEMAESFQKVHDNFLTYVGFVAENRDAYHFLPENARDQCEDLHTPPSRSPWVRRYYDGCRSFCVLRAPLQRFWSAFQDWRGSCDAVEEEALQLLEEAKRRPYRLNCFFVPQVEFVYGIPLADWNESTLDSLGQRHRYCDRFLHQENLTAEFQSFMEEIGRPDVKLPKEFALAKWSHCEGMTAQNLTTKTKKAIYEFYRADYEAFGFPPPL